MRLPAGFAEVPCAGCGTFTKGLAFGEYCEACRRRRERRARSIARRISLLVTALAGIYVAMRLPPTPIARLWTAIGVAITYLVVRRIAHKALLQHLKH